MVFKSDQIIIIIIKWVFGNSKLTITHALSDIVWSMDSAEQERI